MKEQLRAVTGKRTGVWLVGVCTVLCTTMSLNPISMAYFTAGYIEGGARIFFTLIMGVAVIALMPFLPAVKYAMAMIIAGVLIPMFEARKGECSKAFAAAIAGISVCVVHISGALMTNDVRRGMLIGVLEGVLVAVLTPLFSIGIRRLLKEKRAEPITNDEMVALGLLAGVLLYAFRDYAFFTDAVGPVLMYFLILFNAYRYGIGFGAAVGTACGVVITLWQDDIMMLGVMCVIGVLAGMFRSLGKLGTAIGYLVGIYFLGILYEPFLLDGNTQLQVMYAAFFFLLLPRRYCRRVEQKQRRWIAPAELEEKKERILETADSFRTLSKSIGQFREENDFAFAAAVQFNETAGMLENMTDMLDSAGEGRKIRGKQMDRILRRYHMEMKDLYITKQSNGKDRIKVSLRTSDKRIMMTKEVCRVMSEAYGKPVKAASNCKSIANGEYAPFTFVEEPRFMVLSGMAGVSKDGEEVSGDSFTLMELAEGQMLMGIVDGMGSGSSANEDSEEIISLLEELLKSGFEERSALRMVNSVLLGQDGKEASTAVDIAALDLYAGTCSFLKSGAAATFIKRNRWVEMMKSTSLPVGVLRDVDYENVEKKLYPGDYIIMVSDGVLEAVEGEEKEKLFSKLLMDMGSKNPKEMADEILEQVIEMAGDEARDDMTVLVSGIWKKAG